MSIPHFSGLSIKRQKKAAEDYDLLVFSEKVDGTQISFGYDESGRFWTTRKNEPKKFSVEEWGSEPWTEIFRIAHAWLALTWIKALNFNRPEADLELIIPSDLNGMSWSAEVVSKLNPNTIGYPQDVIGVYDGVFDTKKPISVNDTLLMPFSSSSDGIKLEESLHSINFKYLYLNRTLPLTQFIPKPNLVSEETLIAGIRKCAANIFREIEGFVVTHPEGWQFKIVDKERFTLVNKLNWGIRKKINKSPGGKENSIFDLYEKDLVEVGYEQASTMAMMRLDALLHEFNAHMGNYSDAMKQVNRRALAIARQRLRSR